MKKLSTYIIKLKKKFKIPSVEWIVYYCVLEERGTYISFLVCALKCIWEGRQLEIFICLQGGALE